MLQAKDIIGATAEVLLEPRSEGTCAVYIVEARNRQEIRELKELFGSLDPELELRQLAEGTVTAYAVRVPGPDLRILDEIELALRENYRFSISERSFQKTIYAVVRDLCQASNSTLRSVPACGICGNPEPFPTTVEFRDSRGRSLTEGSYCARCVKAAGAADDRDLIQRLLAADHDGLAPLARLRLSDDSRRREAVTEFHIDEEDGPWAVAAG